MPTPTRAPRLPTTSVGPRDVTHWRTRAGRRLADGHARIASRVGAHRTLAASLVVGGAIAAAAASSGRSGCPS